MVMSMKIVLEVISHTADTVNGRPFERYKLKTLENHKVFVNDGFAQVGTVITVGDVIEHMNVVGCLSGSELCKAFYEAKEIEEITEKRISVTKNRGFVHRAAPVIPKKVEIKPAAEQMSLF